MTEKDTDTSGSESYVIVNTRTGLQEAGPFPPDEVRDRLAETREKLRSEAERCPVFVPTDLKLRRYEDTGTERAAGEQQETGDE